MDHGASQLKIWWCSNASCDEQWWFNRGFALLGCGVWEIPHDLQIIIFHGLNAAEIARVIERLGSTDKAPLCLSTGEQTPRCQQLKESLFAECWPAVIVMAWNRYSQRFSSASLVEELDDAHRRLLALESQLRDHQDELVALETQAAMSQLVRTLAHELNNPLAVILGNTELLAQTFGSADEKSGRRTTTIIEQVTICQYMINRLRQYARPQGQPAQALQLPKVLKEALGRQQRRGSPPLAIRIEGEMPLVACGRLALVRAVEQFFDNALRAGASEVVLTASVDHEQRRCSLYFANNGDTPADLDVHEAFHPFFSSNERAGLGLTLAASLLAEYRGTVGLARGKDGSGALVTVILPHWDDEFAQREAQAISSDDQSYRDLNT